MTTHWAHADRPARTYPSLAVHRGARYIDAGEVVTSAGVSAGIDMSLYLVGRLKGPAVAAETARGMEYDQYTPDG